MKGRVEGERDQGNAHLVQDRGQIGPAQKETKREKERMSCFGIPPFRQQQQQQQRFYQRAKAGQNGVGRGCIWW